MRALIGFVPFFAPTAPPYGLACLKGALGAHDARHSLTVADWNLALFRRWMSATPPTDICALDPLGLLGRMCPHLLVAESSGPALFEALRTLPTDDTSALAYAGAAKRFDELYNALAGLISEILGPMVRAERWEHDAAAETLFATEFEDIDRCSPELFGASVLTENNLLYALALTRAVKARWPDIRVVLGGAMMSHLRAEELLVACPWLDLISWGEGEDSLPALMDALEADTSLEEIGGLAHRKHDQICCHSPAGGPDLNSLPFPDFTDFDVPNYLAPSLVLPIATCRGCYWGKCTFCSHVRPYAPGVRVRPAGQVVDEIEYQMAQHGVSSFLFVDEALAPKTLGRLSTLITERKLDITWGAEGVRIERAVDKELLQTARQAGLTWIYVGVESSLQRILDEMHKGISAKDIERLIAACDEAGIIPQLSFIVGFPGTTPEELEAEIAFLGTHPVDASIFALLDGSPIHANPGRYGIQIEDRNVLLETATGKITGPKIHFTGGGASSAAASRALADLRQGTRPRRRPHLGEVHAVLLGATDYFQRDSRPEPGPPAPLVALRRLGDPRVSADSTVHAAGCLEALGDVGTATGLVRTVVAAHASKDKGAAKDPRLRLHLAGLLNRQQRPDLALTFVGGSPTDGELLGLGLERTRSLAMLGEHQAAAQAAQALLAHGADLSELWGLVGESLEATGDPEQALRAYEAGGAADWMEPAYDEARARCLQTLGRPLESAAARAKAARKRSDTTP